MHVSIVVEYSLSHLFNFSLAISIKTQPCHFEHEEIDVQHPFPDIQFSLQLSLKACKVSLSIIIKPNFSLWHNQETVFSI